MQIYRDFLEKDSAEVAKALLGKILRSRSGGNLTSGIIVETEAYYGPEDPASRASSKRTKINRTMWKGPGTILVYMVHGNWLFNIITGKKETPEGVLIRALEPIDGIEIMKERRDKKKISRLTSGPGKLTQALGISNRHNELDLISSDEIEILNPEIEEEFKIRTSKRVGVTKDLERELRFFISANEHVSRFR